MAAIFVVVPGNEQGGAATHLVAFARAVREAGLDARFCFLSLGSGPLADRLRAVVAVEHLPASPVQAFRALTVRMRAQPPDSLWHAHGPRLNVLVATAARMTGRRWVSTIHSDPRKDFLASAWKSAVFTRLNLTALRSSSGMFLCNPSFSDLVPGKPWFWVPNALAAEPLPEPAAVYRTRLRSQFGIDPDTPVVGMVARLDPVKDIPTAIHAMANLPGVHLAVAGDGGQRTALTAMIAELDLKDRVHLLGHIREIGPFLSSLDVHVLASRSEGLPYAVLEAGYYGIPNVMSDIPAARGLIESERTGLLFPVGNGAVLAAQIRRLLDDTDLARRLAASFQSEILPRFTPARMLDAYLEGYRALGAP
ncbi:glycosyltransferase family 4 protein [Alicyclobacillus macrosporangiidus]|uniref:glycosyltransferase family 4 protein n=1 Tax=Alicyclobacillus macrosporangiidus TaxID=392015 RepID=UPI0006894E94|nr:glycosyltransferase family 4 protein [Alicyclobacillus macrosporangiidus]